jgi:hypothetical protein
MESVPSSAGISYVSRRYLVLGKMEDPHLSQRFANQWFVVRGKAMQLVQPLRRVWRRREGQMSCQKKDGLKFFFETDKLAQRAENWRISVCQSRGSRLVPTAFKGIKDC